MKMTFLRPHLVLACAAGLLLTACDDLLAPEPDLWAEGAWHAMGSGLDGVVWAITEHQDDLYAGGGFSTAEGTRYLLRWDGSSWAPVDPGPDGTVRALVSFDGALVALGHFDHAGGIPANRAARWDGTGWHAMDGNLSDVCCQPMLATDGDRLFASGRFARESDGAVVIGASLWTGTQWSPLEVEDFPAVAAFVVHDGNLIANVRWRYTVARWDGSAWTWLGEPQEMLRHLVSVGDDLYAVTREGAVSVGVARWTGEAWSEVGQLDGSVYAAIAHEGSLVLGGAFEGEHAGAVVRLGPEGWEVIDGGADGAVYALAPNGRSLVAAGSFTTLGGAAARGIAALSVD